MKHYYVDNSSIFNSPPYYQVEVIQRYLKAIPSLALRVNSAQKNGWTNLPKVVTFSANAQDLEMIHSVLQANLGHSVIINVKDWK